MYINKQSVGRPSARTCVLGGMMVLVALSLLMPPAWAQLKPELNAKIPAYAPLALADGTLDISGSDSMKPLLQSWIGDLTRRHPGVKVTLRGAGSQTGLKALLEHQVEVAAMSRRMTATEIAEFVKEYGFEPTEVPVAIDALAVFVHKDNPVVGLSLEELDAMFCRERRRGIDHSIATWGLVGLTDDWFDAPIRIYGRNGNSGTSYFFREEVCKGGTFHPQLVGSKGPASVIMDLVKDPHGVGFSAIGYQTSSLKAVPIAAVKGGRYVEPNFETATDGSYPLRRHLYLYIAKPPKTVASPLLSELVRFALSAQGQQSVLDYGYYPLALTDITRLMTKWSGPVKSAQLPTPEQPIAQ